MPAYLHLLVLKPQLLLLVLESIMLLIQLLYWPAACEPQSVRHDISSCKDSWHSLDFPGVSHMQSCQTPFQAK